VNTTFEQFIRERKYLSNVSLATIEWYRQSLRWLGTEQPSQERLKDFVLRMRERGLTPAACDNRIRAVKAYLKSTGSSSRVPRLKEPEFIRPTFTLTQVCLLTGWNPKDFDGRRLHLLILILLRDAESAKPSAYRFRIVTQRTCSLRSQAKGVSRGRFHSHLNCASICSATRGSFVCIIIL
jgi:hypothetical protein